LTKTVKIKNYHDNKELTINKNSMQEFKKIVFRFCNQILFLDGGPRIGALAKVTTKITLTFNNLALLR